jgi:hypothetical protein
MPFTVKYGGDVEIEAATAADLEIVLAVIDKRRAGATVPATEPGGVPERMGQLIDSLSEQHILLLSALSLAPAGLDDKGLTAKLELPSRRNIGGLLMGITKKARALGLNMDKQVVTKRVERSADGERTYTYRLRPEALEALRDANLYQWPEQPEAPISGKLIIGGSQVIQGSKFLGSQRIS